MSAVGFSYVTAEGARVGIVTCLPVWGRNPAGPARVQRRRAECPSHLARERRRQVTALPLPTEAECQTAIIEAARAFGYRVHHQRPARLADGRIRTTIQGDKGFPDLVIAGHGRVWIVELKRHGNRPSPEQVQWITALCAAGIDARVLIVPTGQQAFIDEMQRAKDTR